jgi:hypothetical protein
VPDKVFINARGAVYQGGQGQSLAFPDVCLCPPTPPAGPVPTPLPNTVMAADLAGGARTVLIADKPAGKRSSYLAKSTGNEVAQSTGGGVVSHTVQGKAYFQTFSTNVFIEGEPAVRHLDVLTHNHLAQPGNTGPAVWMSTMNAPAVAGPGPKRLSKAPERSEGKSGIHIIVVDEVGDGVETEFRVTTPAGQTIEDCLLWGGTLTLRNLADGRCRLVLPKIDDRCRRFDRRAPAEAGDGELAYHPGEALRLETGRPHRVIVPAFRTLWIEIPRIADDDDSIRQQRFTLRSDDGHYDVTRSIDDDNLGDEDSVMLKFPGVFKGPKYRLAHVDGSRSARDVFSGMPFEALFPRDAASEAIPVHRSVMSESDDDE